ncbi:MAG: hypothetical protein NVSMB4_09190 [Acidimicrobiales bacterium]
MDPAANGAGTGRLKMATADVVGAYGDAWNEGDEASRRKLLEKGWADDGVYCDPMGRADGRDALVAHIAGFHENMPGHRIAVTTNVDEHDGFFRFGWELRAADGTAAIEGVDFGTLDSDGRIASITGFFGPLT